MSQNLRRSAGVLTPLFSIYSKNTIGVGEFPDLNLLVDWCKKTGQRIIQLLPVNDTGFNFRPYDSESSFALESMHISVEKIVHADLDLFKNEINTLREQFPCQGDFYDTTIKKAKLDLLRKIFEKRRKSGDPSFRKFSQAQKFWLGPYAQYKVLKDRFHFTGWMDWPVEFRDRHSDTLKKLEFEESANIEFHEWVQWQVYLQFCEAKKYARRKDVDMMGDIPFLVSRDSADVWTNPSYFKLELSAGAPPDLFFADGQEWGMPPYNWQEIQKNGYDYVIQKLQYAENFYDFFRIDHFIGVFRVWTFKRDLPDEERKRAAAFDPSDESVWEDHGRRIVEVMTRSTGMRPCAEDLGCVPKCSDRVLQDYGIPGIEVQRWMRHWETTKEFKAPTEYRANAIAVISTHDTSPLLAWWKEEAGDQEDRQKLWEVVGLAGNYDPEPSMKLVDACFEFISATQSVFSIQLFQDWLSFIGLVKEPQPEYRINLPGIVNATNWRLRLPLSLEGLQDLPENSKILKLNKKSGRIS